MMALLVVHSYHVRARRPLPRKLTYHVVIMSAFAYNTVYTIAYNTRIVLCLRRRQQNINYCHSSVPPPPRRTVDMVQETLLFLSAAATIVVVGFVRSDCDSGECHRLEICADRPWVESRGEHKDDRVRIVDAPLGSDIAFLCNYCGESDKGQPRFWYTSRRYDIIIL